MPKIFFFMNSYSEGMSGGDLHFIEVARRLEGYEKVVITSLLGREACLNRELDAGFVITTREKRFANVYLIYSRRVLKALFKRLRIDKGDILYSTSDSLPDVLPSAFLRWLNEDTQWVSCVFHLIPSYHERPGPKVRNALAYFAQKASLALIKRWSDRVLVDNSSLREFLIKKGFSQQKLFVTSMGIDKVMIDSVPQPLEKEYDACFLARLHVSKGVFDLVKIWRFVADRKGDARLAIIGDGQPKTIENLKCELQKNNLMDNVSILGFLSTEEALKTMKSSRVFVFPSHEEGWGIAICEAMACGLPVIAYDLPVYSEIFPNGLIQVQKGDHHAFGERILELLSDDDKYQRLSREAEQTAHAYQWSNVAERELGSIRKLEPIDR